MTQDTALTVAAASGVLSNDTDANGDALTAVLVANPSHGTVTLNNNGSFTYTPTTGYAGADSFTYQASDGKATSNTATVSITVNDPPTTTTPLVAIDHSYTTTKDTTLTVAAPGVLSNNSGTNVLTNATGASSGVLTAVLVGNPYHGAVTLRTNGSFPYMPVSGFTGSDYFTYKACNGTATSATATITIAVVDSTAQSSASAIFGLNDGNKTWNHAANMIDFMRFKNTAGTGNLTKLELKFDDTTPNGKVRLGVYADNNGKPGALLLNAGEVTVTNGWVSISGLNLAVKQNTYYWLAFSMQRGNGVVYLTGQARNSHYWISWKYGSLPSRFNSRGAGSNNAPYVMRATVVLASTN